MNERLIAEIKALIAAPTCCPEAKAVAENYLAVVGTDKESDEAKNLLKELEEDIESIDDLLAFVNSPKCVELFGDKAKFFIAHANELKASGAKYCDCPACSACEKIIEILK